MQRIAHQTAARRLSPQVPPQTSRQDITYSMAMSGLGRVLVARSSAGVCAILFGENDDELETELSARFPTSRLKADDGSLRAELAKVVKFIDAPSGKLDFAVDMRGTPFQCRVWDALRTIPVGTTITYAELARRIGAASSVRAVASACASNALALAVPCHRVVRSNRELAGYRWGIERKRALLAKEAQQ